MSYTQARVASSAMVSQYIGSSLLNCSSIDVATYTVQSAELLFYNDNIYIATVAINFGEINNRSDGAGAGKIPMNNNS